MTVVVAGGTQDVDTQPGTARGGNFGDLFGLGGEEERVVGRKKVLHATACPASLVPELWVWCWLGAACCFAGWNLISQAKPAEKIGNPSCIHFNFFKGFPL